MLFSLQFFLFFVFIARFMNFSSFTMKGKIVHSALKTLRENEVGVFLWGLKWRFTMIASLYDAFLLRKFECEERKRFSIFFHGNSSDVAFYWIFKHLRVGDDLKRSSIWNPCRHYAVVFDKCFFLTNSSFDFEIQVKVVSVLG